MYPLFPALLNVAGKAAGERPGGHPDSPRVPQSQREAEEDIFSQ